MSGRYPDFIKIAQNAQVDYVIADPHLAHENIFLHTDRKYIFKDYHEWNDYYVETHNRIVSKGDCIVIIGDLAFSDHAKYINALNGKKILILGNHDKMATELYNRFTGVYPFHVRTINGQYVTLHHWPMMSWAEQYEGGVHLYGHTHGRTIETPKIMRMDMSIDVWWQPIHWDIVSKKFEMKKNGQFIVDYTNKDDVNKNSYDLAKRNLTFLIENAIPVDEKIKKFYGLETK